MIPRDLTGAAIQIRTGDLILTKLARARLPYAYALL